MKIHFLDSQICKVHSPTIFCVVPSDSMGFWDASFSPSDLTRRSWRRIRFEQKPEHWPRVYYPKLQDVQTFSQPFSSYKAYKSFVRLQSSSGIPKTFPPSVALRSDAKWNQLQPRRSWGRVIITNQVKLWSCQLWTQFLQLRREAWKIQDFNGVWTRDLAISVRRSNQLTYEATNIGSWSFVGSNGPVRNESKMKWYMKWIIYELRIWNQLKLWSSQLWTQFLQLRRDAWKIQDFNGVWTRDLAIPVWRSNQLSYEVINVGSWSFVGSNGPVKNESMMKWYMKWIIYELRIWNQVYDLRSYERNF